MADFQDSINNPEEPISNEEIVKQIESDNEKDYYKKLKKKNKNYLIKLTGLEKERVAQYIVDRYKEALPKHEELIEKLDKYDETYRMVRKEQVGSAGDAPNYVSPLSTVTLEVVHANVINVLFSPKDPIRALPTEESDVRKISNIDIFANWSAKNELKLFENMDRLFHASSKNGENPYIVHWVKEYGTEIKRKVVKNPANNNEPMYDPDTKEPIYQEVEEQKLLYNAPKLEIFSRKDYILPPDHMADMIPDYEFRKVRLTYDDVLKDELSGIVYSDTLDEIPDWKGNDQSDSEKEDYEGQNIPVGKYKKLFLEFYGRLRIKVIKSDSLDELEEYEELEDEFIALVHEPTQTLCALRKNKFPLKKRPIGMDYFLLDDDGRAISQGIIEVMDGAQRAYDALFNQFVLASINANSPIVIISPQANMRDEKIKLQNGYMYPLSDPNSIKTIEFPRPDQSVQILMETVRNWAQLLFGISDYSAGLESQIDPTAPAKKAEIVVQQGSVRLNMIIKRKVKTVQDIMTRWFLLYQANMPPNKFMRIVGDSKDNPWKFQEVTLSDFALKALPDFELTGNILNVNKSLEAQKAIAIYQLMSQNLLFNPQTITGLQAYYGLTKWLVDRLDDGTGLGRLIPKAPGDIVHTPEEENARFLQGDEGEPLPNEDHVYHINVHREFLINPTLPIPIKEQVVDHINKHVELLKTMLVQQQVLGGAGQQQGQWMGGTNANVASSNIVAPGGAEGMVQ